MSYFRFSVAVLVKAGRCTPAGGLAEYFLKVKPIAFKLIFQGNTPVNYV
jgi:hypothetical protein